MVGDDQHSPNEPDVNDDLHQLANFIAKELENPVANECIQLCGLAPLQIIATRPNDVLDLAVQRLNAQQFAQVQKHWRRLYEDASLHKFVKLLKDRVIEMIRAGKRRHTGDISPTCGDDDWLSSAIILLEKGLMMSGAPGRKKLFDSSAVSDLPHQFNIAQPKALQTPCPIARATSPMAIDQFQDWLNTAARPMIIPGTMQDWPATRKWHNPRYLMSLTLGGRRMVPVEVGRAYTDDDWQQTIISFREFIVTYVLPDKPEKVGYLAQHDLFEQIPKLKADIMVPDYCYSCPSSTDVAALKTAGLEKTEPLEEPLLNAWLGPKGTKTPLHTDPYHNILCQVVGYKYVRLYPPDQAANLYPCGTDEKGINMENTSQVDVCHVRTTSLSGTTDLDAIREIKRKYPLFATATYQEAILAPGECLYIPLGWWHYVESLSTSFSVSFWWN
ncbi:hypothetical protein M433DRAFT_140082 [Acidomyces richmondensis BFW]|nr:MAG: hypothetical protein FE78DRAFT_82536 [Acidomyces sp. 'richmondensis']KYG49404.1 hypothetical protein M433DRAFT_140082 [Acidomyces richmondensis BFW]